MIQYLKRTWAVIDLDAIAHNVRTIQSSLQPGCRVMAIVKADAYGHGAGYVSRTLRDAGVTWFGVSNLEEALQIREAGIAQSILILGYTPPCEAARLAEYAITQTVFDADYAAQLSQAALAAGVNIRVHVKIDTGMSRLGFLCQNKDDIPAAVQTLETVCRLPGLIPEGIFTHFASADEQDDGGYTKKQFDCFMALIEAMKERGVHFALRHCCNSAGTLRYPEMHLDLVRPGLILYGLAPDDWMRSFLPLEPAMTLKTVVSMVKSVPGGTSVSYGRIFTTADTTRLATVPIGYADGYPRAMSGKAYMLLGGKRVPVVGRVCMDQCVLDVTDIEDVHEGMTVTVFGCDDEACIPVEEYSAWCSTINYETICLIGKRVPRIFYHNNREIGQLNYIVPDSTYEP